MTIMETGVFMSPIKEIGLLMISGDRNPQEVDQQP